GLPEMDFWLTDSFLHPKNTREFFTEKLYRLPNFYQFNAPDDFPKVSVPPVKETGFITFGSFNKPEKINDVVIKLWAKILNEVPGSRLLMKYGAYFNDPILVDYWQDKFSQFGVDNDCLIFNDQNTDRISHLKTYSHIDIALDPFPFNGATTTFEALAMGVPVITLAGNSFVSRVGGSLLKNLNLDNLIADTQEEYVRLARNLAFDVDTTEKLRKSLRSTLSNSDLCQGKAYTQTVEAAYRNMWTKWCVSFKRKKSK
ncbi:MAG: hypothetical protein VX693_07605, partial [Pseudomonadota bacterium]|nr:hypothetical protein [Pseudomonadota bacterium]